MRRRGAESFKGVCNSSLIEGQVRSMPWRLNQALKILEEPPILAAASAAAQAPRPPPMIATSVRTASWRL